MRELYEMFRTGLEMTAGPSDPTFEELWETYSSVTREAEYLLLSERFNANVDGADEVALYLARFSRVAKISRGMPLHVPEPSSRAIRAMGRMLDRGPSSDELGAFLSLASPIANDLARYASTHLGRYSRPVLDALTVTARAAALMNHCVFRLVPELNDREVNL